MFHKSAKGRVVNFDELVHRNATTIAVGNANLNARGDLIGPGGKVIETAEQRGKQGESMVTTTSKVSVQSEISSLKAARSQWAGSEVPVSEEVQEVAPAQEDAPGQAEPVAEVVPEVVEAPKKARKITESE